MSEYIDNEDRLTERNLRSAIPLLSIPPAPTAAQRLRWKAAATVQEARRGRWSAAAWLSSSVAAMVAISAFFFAPSHSGNGTVHAAMIFRNLREASHRGLLIELRNIQAEGYRVDGRVQVAFKQPISLAAIVSDDFEPQFEAAAGELTVLASPDAEELAGMELATAFEVRSDKLWMYVKFVEFPQSLLEEEPMVALFVPVLQRGLLLDIDDATMKVLDLGDMLNDDSAADASTDQLKLQIEAGASRNDAKAGVAVKKDDKPAGGLQLDGVDAATEQMLRGLLSGEAGRDQLQALVTMLEQAAGRVDLREKEKGVWVLTAGDFKVEDLGMDAEEAEMLRNAVLRITYAEGQGQGVQGLEIDGLGRSGGQVVVRFTDDATVLAPDRNRYIRDGAQVFDVGAMMRMFQSFGQVELK